MINISSSVQHDQHILHFNGNSSEKEKTEETEDRLRKRRLMSRKEAFMLLPHFITAKVKNLDLSRFRSGSANQNV